MIKFVPEHEYDIYSQMQPVYGYYVDDDPKSASFGEVLFGQIGERNAYNDVLEFKDETDISYIKKQLLKMAKDSDWNAEFDEDMKEEINGDEQVDIESSVKGGDDDIQDDSADAVTGEQEEKKD